MENHCPVTLDTAGQDVHAEAERIRENGPVARVELPGGVLAWSVTGYEEAKKVLSDSRISKDPQKWPAFTSGEIPSNWPLIGWLLMDNMTTNDDPDHMRLRKLVSRAFTPRRVEDTRPLIEKTVHDLLDQLEEAGPDEVVDLKGRFATPLPARVICEMFGVPESARNAVLRGAGVNVTTSISGDEAEANVEKWHEELYELAEIKRRTPGDDLTSVVLAAREDDGTRLTDEEMVGTLHLMLGAGSETLMNALSHAVLALLSQPEQRELLEAGQISWDDVIEETLRVQAPVAQLPLRFATDDIEVGGVVINKGDPVLMGFAAVGRDPDVHGASAAEFDATRTDKTHLSFGHGSHFCLGAPLARLELRIALPALFARFPDLSLGVRPDELEPQGTFIMNGHSALPVRLGSPVPASI
ncbi:cytochrome P450 [Haloechinothrix sp. YIM 98757]|uniref:Cytochrome P450 n=1 Tax=Haloechinothrix aidingensis TaxID=2752311 RepID=A0A838A7T6_9PSEU|nr:cytochrome P450 [Haloechinothrix aidingensis]MBA0125308.1 cytochrome P450 [Haloechinothrix aidingensis]